MASFPLASSLRALLAHRLRAILALLSVSIGVAAVILSSAISTGAQREVLRRMESMGPNLLVVRPAPVKRLVARRAIAGTVRTLHVDDHAAIAALAWVIDAAPGVEGAARVKRGTTATMTTVRGTTPAFLTVRSFRLRSGRFLDGADDRAARRVAVLAARVADTLFAREDPVGREIRIRGVPFEVVGVLAPKGVTADGADEDNQILIPVRTALRRVFNTTWLDAIFVRVKDPRRMDEAAAGIGALLRARHRAARGEEPDDFAIQNTMRFLAMQKQAADALGLLTIGLAGLALLVGGCGILALMLLAVKERTGEIGLRMAVGATPRDILVQFLAEAALLALGGWLAGVMMGGLGAAALAAGTRWPIAVPLPAIYATLALTTIVGFGFGVVPARKASLITPIDALVSE